MISARPYSQNQYESYNQFIRYVQSSIQEERTQTNRKMFSVFLFCFLLPAVLSFSTIILIRMGVIPRDARSYVDWAILFFPIAYGFYAIGLQGLREVTSGLRRGGVTNALEHSLKQNTWREKNCAELKQLLGTQETHWRWIVECYRADLQAMRRRNYTVTVFAASIFFFILHGIDLFDPATEIPLKIHPVLLISLLESAFDKLNQIIALAIFLLLFFMTGMELVSSLEKFLHCAELLLLQAQKDDDLNKKSARRIAS